MKISIINSALFIALLFSMSCKSPPNRTSSKDTTQKSTTAQAVKKAPSLPAPAARPDSSDEQVNLPAEKAPEGLEWLNHSRKEGKIAVRMGFKAETLIRGEGFFPNGTKEWICDFNERAEATCMFFNGRDAPLSRHQYKKMTVDMIKKLQPLRALTETPKPQEENHDAHNHGGKATSEQAKIIERQRQKFANKMKPVFDRLDQHIGKKIPFLAALAIAEFEVESGQILYPRRESAALKK